MRRTGVRLIPRLMSLAALAAFALFCPQPARTAEDPHSYVVCCDSDINVVSLPETPPEKIASMCGYEPEEYIILTEERDGYTLVTLRKALDVTLEADGEVREIRATGGTVGELLEEFDVTLGEEDIVSHAADAPLEDGMAVKIGRVTYKEVSEEEAIPHGTVYKDSDSLYKGTEETVTEGSDGVRRYTYRVKYIDGVETGRELVNQETVTEAVDTVIARGTKEKEKPKPAPAPTPAPSTGNSSSGSGGGSTQTHTVTEEAGTITTPSGEVFTYSKFLTMKATAYTFPPGAITSSGAEVQVGIVAALPSTLKPGTRVYIVTVDGQFVYGPAIVGDTPGSDIIDLFYDTLDECYQFGAQQAYVYILD